VKLRSMSGHGEARVEGPEALVEVRIRSVNHRNRDVSVKVLPEEWDFLEPEVERRLVGRLRRGTVRCRVEIHLHGRAAAGWQVNGEVIRDYARQLRAAAREANLSPLSGVGELLRLPGVLVARPRRAVSGSVQRTVLLAVGKAVDTLLEAREFEGGRLGQQLRELVGKMEGEVERMAAEAPLLVENYRRRLRRRLEELRVEAADGDLLAREVALMAERSDISEEVVRLQSHLAQVRRTLERGGVCGRRLDFLAQEIMREVNTIGAKARGVRMGRLVVDLKLKVEKFREQAQNLE